jgi:hypothetical protein
MPMDDPVARAGRLRSGAGQHPLDIRSMHAAAAAISNPAA